MPPIRRRKGTRPRKVKKTRKRRAPSARGPRKRLRFTKRSRVVRRNRGRSDVTCTIGRRTWKRWMRNGLRDLRQFKTYTNTFPTRSSNALGFQNSIENVFLRFSGNGTPPSTDPGSSAAKALDYIYFAYNNGLSSANRVRYIYIEDLHVEMEIASASQYEQTVIIRDLVCRRNEDYSPLRAWDDGLTVGDKAVSVQGASPGTITNQTYMATPYQSNMFCQLWKIIGEKKIKLKAGESHKHILKVAVKKRINVDDYELPAIFRQGLTFATMITHYGQPASQTINSVSQVQNLGGALNIISTMRFRYRIDHNENTDQNIMFNNMSATSGFTAPQVINQATMDIDTTLTNA